MEHTEKFLAVCEASGYPAVSWSGPGGHNWEYWNANLERMMDFCLDR